MASETKTLGMSRGAWIVAFCCLASLAEGVDLQAPGVTMPVLGPLFHLGTGEGGGFVAGFLSQKSLFLSMSTFGLMFGAMIGGRLSDLIGRKWVMVLSVAVFGVFSAVTAQSTNADMLLWTRFLTGLGLGGCYPNMIAIAVENVSPQRRNTAVGVLYSFMPVGGATVSLASYALATPAHWQMIYYIGALLPLIALPGIIFGVPNHKPLKDRKEKKPSLGFALFGEGRATRTSILWLAFLSALVTQYILLSWLPSLLISKGLPKPDASLAQLAFNVFAVPGAIITGILIDRPGRSTTTALAFLSVIIALGVLAVAPATLSVSLAVAGLAGLTMSGSQAICYAMAPACYPTYVRGTGVGFAVAFGRIGAAIGPLLAGAMIGAGLPATAVLSVMAPLMVVSGICVWWISRTTEKVPKFAEADAAALANA
jgi:AAHS family 3-hydroxyphenylpropionic acid transporter